MLGAVVIDGGAGPIFPAGQALAREISGAGAPALRGAASRCDDPGLRVSSEARLEAAGSST